MRRFLLRFSENSCNRMCDLCKSGDSTVGLSTMDRDRLIFDAPPAVTCNLSTEAKDLLSYFQEVADCDLTVAKLRDAACGVSLPAPSTGKKRKMGKKRGAASGAASSMLGNKVKLLC